jgi:hypothetical protein
MVSCRFGGEEGIEVRLVDEGDLVVLRTHRRGARHDISPLSRSSRRAHAALTPLFGFPAAGVGVWHAPEGRSEELSRVLNEDTEVRFAGRGLRDQFGAPVVYTENLFVRFADGVKDSDCEEALRSLSLQVKRSLPYAGNAYFAGSEEGTGREIFQTAERLLERGDVELCHPELIREIGWNSAFPEQWHLQQTVIDGNNVDAHTHVTSAWELSEGEEIEALNRRLSHLIGGDPSCTDRGRIMRLPGSFNGRRGRWCRVLRADRSRALVDPDQVRRAVPDPEPPQPDPATSNGYQGLGQDELALTDPPTYFRALAGIEVPATGMTRCPLPDHEDTHSSCRVWAEPERGWWCYGCARGGRIFDLASLMAGGPWGGALRDDAFLRARELASAALPGGLPSEQ